MVMLQARKKIEIILGQTYIPRVLSLVKQANISGYTLIKNVLGSGIHGEQDAQELIDVTTNSYFIIIATEEKAKFFAEQVQLLMKKSGGMLLVSDVQLII